MSLVNILSIMSRQAREGAVISPPGPVPALQIGTFIYDEFDTFTNWTALNSPTYQTVSASGSKLHVVGKSTVKNAGLAINRTAYGKSTLRNYELETSFKLNNIGGTNFGVILGVNSQRNPDQNASTYALFNTVNNTLEIAGTDTNNNIGVTSASIPVPNVNINDTYTLKFKMVEDTVTATLDNGTGSIQTVSFTYDFTTPYAGDHIKPNIFYYSFGVNGTTDAHFEYFKAKSTELQNPDILFLGDSITTGYYGGDAINTYAYKLRSHTTQSIQVQAGGYNKVQDVSDNLFEALARQPGTVFVMIGTNDGASAAAFTTIQSIMTDLSIAGIAAVPLLIPDGGNPATAGTYNEKIKTAYPATIDTWTTGFNTMSTTNGEMVDTVHPTNTGYIKLASIIKSARPDLFPL